MDLGFNPADFDLDPSRPRTLRPDGRGVWIVPLTGRRARVVVGPVDFDGYDDGW